MDVSSQRARLVLTADLRPGPQLDGLRYLPQRQTSPSTTPNSNRLTLYPPLWREGTFSCQGKRGESAEQRECARKVLRRARKCEEAKVCAAGINSKRFIALSYSIELLLSHTLSVALSLSLCCYRLSCLSRLEPCSLQTVMIPSPIVPLRGI